MEKNMSQNKIQQHPFYTLGEEIFNAVSHGAGAALAVAGCVIAVIIATMNGGVLEIASATIYGVTLILLYTMSTLYHSFTGKTVKKVFRIFDHCSIYLLIAGTYTPFTLVSLKGVYGYSLFAVVWAVGVVGIVFSAINMEKYKKLLMFCYIAAGWVVVFATKPLLDAMSLNGVLLLAGGGLFYTGGILFYKQKKIRYMHSIWHLFVLGGSILHYFAIILYVFPKA